MSKPKLVNTLGGDPGISFREQAGRLEVEEYESAIEDLLDSPSFVRVMAVWFMDTETARAPVEEARLGYHNFAAGRHSLPAEMIEKLRIVSPKTFDAIQEEINRYVSRRHTAHERDAQRDNDRIDAEYGAGDFGAED